jgi:FKBP-type peptidyl-prolyl cis-trans isomerase 2
MIHAHRDRVRLALLTLTAVFVSAGLLLHPDPASATSPIKEGSNVTLLYEITVPDGGYTVKDIGQFVQGEHQILPALEREVTGMTVGDKKEVKLSVEDGFGPYDENKKKTIPKTELPAGTKQGDLLEDGSGRPATVTEVSDSSAVLDYNHPLAGKPVVVELTILKVEDPS